MEALASSTFGDVAEAPSGMVSWGFPRLPPPDLLRELGDQATLILRRRGGGGGNP